MSNVCQKNFALTVGPNPVGPPFGPLQVDAATVAQQNTWASIIHSHGCDLLHYTGFLPFVGFDTWEGDSIVFKNATNDWWLEYGLSCNVSGHVNPLGGATYEHFGPDPTGIYTLIDHSPVGNILFADGTALPNWFPSPPTTVSVSWA